MDYVLGFMFTPDKEKVLLIKKTKPTWQAGHINGIGGKIEEGEDGNDAMAREFEEECGIKTNPANWEHCVFHYRFGFGGDAFRLFVYRCFGDITQAQHIEEEEPIVVEVANLPDIIIPNLRWIIPMLLNEEVDFPVAVPCK
jgi:8-oxo-dGTP diphosphatase